MASAFLESESLDKMHTHSITDLSRRDSEWYKDHGSKGEDLWQEERP